MPTRLGTLAQGFSNPGALRSEAQHLRVQPSVASPFGASAVGDIRILHSKASVIAMVGSRCATRVRVVGGWEVREWSWCWRSSA